MLFALSPTINELSDSMVVLSILAYVGGLATCWMYRRLSWKLLLVAAGFAGLLTSAAGTKLVSLAFGQDQFLMDLVYSVATFLDALSNMLLTFGLAWSLLEIRRKVALALEPSHVRR